MYKKLGIRSNDTQREAPPSVRSRDQPKADPWEPNSNELPAFSDWLLKAFHAAYLISIVMLQKQCRKSDGGTGQEAAQAPKPAKTVPPAHPSREHRRVCYQPPRRPRRAVPSREGTPQALSRLRNSEAPQQHRRLSARHWGAVENWKLQDLSNWGNK